jgi:branched-chain amino acid transport system substrate-binding protein
MRNIMSLGLGRRAAAGWRISKVAVVAAFVAGLAPAVHAAESLKIGMVAPLTGGAAETGRYQINGAKLAVAQVNKAGGVLGRQIDLMIEDDQTTNPGAVSAFNKLSSDADVLAFLAPIRSTQVHAIAPNVKTVGKPVAFGGTDPRLTKIDNPWLFRFRPNDELSTRALAAFGVNELQKKKWAIVYSTDAFGSTSMKLLSEALEGLGVKPVLAQGFTTGTQDFTPVALAVKQSGADIIVSYATSETDQAIFAKQLRQFGVNAPIAGSASIASATALKLAGADLYDSYSMSDYSAAANPEAGAFAKAYKEAYGAEPDFFASWSYDAVRTLAAAIGKSGGVNPEGIRKALTELRDFKGAEGTYNFDASGEGLNGYNIVQNKQGIITFIKRVEVKK